MKTAQHQQHQRLQRKSWKQIQVNWWTRHFNNFDSFQIKVLCAFFSLKLVQVRYNQIFNFNAFLILCGTNLMPFYFHYRFKKDLNQCLSNCKLQFIMSRNFPYRFCDIRKLRFTKNPNVTKYFLSFNTKFFLMSPNRKISLHYETNSHKTL